ncbi:hypothetical protein TRIP_E160068 [uncultured Spirochaetota bacterium]|uniref:Uncharacterized protein n=1 Tax=uncultured Spirochaetota bacterium TaxID=460511 RepID=A0A652ZST8_9SPIR|nr:hypothetical protein TRIP_E160068 [uncultured Spirochaetota bacterium]
MAGPHVAFRGNQQDRRGLARLRQGFQLGLDVFAGRGPEGRCHSRRGQRRQRCLGRRGGDYHHYRRRHKRGQRRLGRSRRHGRPGCGKSIQSGLGSGKANFRSPVGYRHLVQDHVHGRNLRLPALQPLPDHDRIHGNRHRPGPLRRLLHLAGRGGEYRHVRHIHHVRHVRLEPALVRLRGHRDDGRRRPGFRTGPLGRSLLQKVVERHQVRPQVAFLCRRPQQVKRDNPGARAGGPFASRRGTPAFFGTALSKVLKEDDGYLEKFTSSRQAFGSCRRSIGGNLERSGLSLGRGYQTAGVLGRQDAQTCLRHHRLGVRTQGQRPFQRR